MGSGYNICIEYSSHFQRSVFHAADLIASFADGDPEATCCLIGLLQRLSPFAAWSLCTLKALCYETQIPADGFQAESDNRQRLSPQLLQFDVQIVHRLLHLELSRFGDLGEALI